MSSHLMLSAWLWAAFVQKKKIKKIIFKTQGKPSILTQHLRNPSAEPAVAFPRWAVPLLGAGWEVLKA